MPPCKYFNGSVWVSLGGMVGAWYEQDFSHHLISQPMLLHCHHVWNLHSLIVQHTRSMVWARLDGWAASDTNKSFQSPCPCTDSRLVEHYRMQPDLPVLSLQRLNFASWIVLCGASRSEASLEHDISTAACGPSGQLHDVLQYRAVTRRS